MSKQLKLKSSVRIIFESENECKVASSAEILQATITSCQCAFWTSTQLPCRRIFVVRERGQISLFCERLIAPRWSLNHMKAVYGNKVTSFHSESYQVNE